jgi:hypothetical protein
MKKFFVLVFTAITFFSAANAQIQFGVKAGANFATLTGSASEGATTKVDFHGGVFGNIPLISSFFLQPELVYSGQGAKATANQTDFTINQSYLNVPVLLQYHHGSGLFLETGPQVGFLLAANVKSGGESQDVKSSYKSTDFSWAFGLGFKIPLIHAGIDARYNLGLTNIAAQQDAGETIKNSVFQVGVFYVLGK